jgi:hypothetical protein
LHLISSSLSCLPCHQHSSVYGMQSGSFTLLILLTSQTNFNRKIFEKWINFGKRSRVSRWVRLLSEISFAYENVSIVLPPSAELALQNQQQKCECKRNFCRNQSFRMSRKTIPSVCLPCLFDFSVSHCASSVTIKLPSPTLLFGVLCCCLSSIETRDRGWNVV